MVSEQNIKQRLTKALRGRRLVEGVTLDSNNTRRMDDGFNLQKTDDGWTLEFSVADVASMVQKGDELDEFVKEAAANDERYIFPDSFSVGACSLQKNKTRPAITFTMQFAEDFELTDYKIDRTAFKSLKKFGNESIENVPQDEREKWVEFATGISNRRKSQMHGALTRNFNRAAGVAGAGFEYYDSCDREHGCVDIIAEMTILTSRVAADYMRKNDLPAFYRISGDMRTEVLNDEELSPELQRWMEEILDDLTDSVDVAHMLSVDVTTPIRRYDNLIMQRILGAHVDGSAAPYTIDELRDLKEFCRWAQKNPNAVKVNFNDIVRATDPMDDRPGLSPESDGQESSRLHRLVQNAGLSLQKVSARVHMLGFSFSLEGYDVKGRDSGSGKEFNIRAVSASSDSNDAKNGAAAGALAQIRDHVPKLYRDYVR